MEQKQQQALEIKKVEQFLLNIKVLSELSNIKPNIDILKSYRALTVKAML